ncbi:hypothetical protein [Mesorhizobium huakuii]|uniref:Uncharacterized protein n=1 Tax=Mesorhizobium huakuii TaxID=28104 RepID=A0A7G6SMC3_9HYPH|nr:hypothetical protein [Mesorhizobium huakuii]QND55655.1 hypothetical protein HB778_02435 [Mesorhizobium huakuii]
MRIHKISLPRHFAPIFAMLVASFLLMGNVTALALDLGPTQCGGEYGALSVAFTRKIKSVKDIDDILSKFPWYSKSFVSFADSSYKTTLKKELHDRWKRGKHYELYSETSDFIVPTGSEKFIGNALIDAGLASQVTHAIGVCGGAEISYALVKKAAVGDISKGPKFEAFLRAALKRYVAPAGKSETIIEGPLSVSPVTPSVPTKRMTVIVPSEISRGPQEKGTWDRYDLLARPIHERPGSLPLSVRS